jgi:tetratricopeptide (TPR) repeat protein
LFVFVAHAETEAYDRILTLVKEGKTTAAEAELKRIIKESPGEALAHFHLGTLYASRGDYLSAVGEYREATHLDPKEGAFLRALGYAYKDIGDYKHAVEALRTSVALTPDAEAYMVLGAILHLEEQDESAKQAFEAGLHLNPKNAEARLMLGDVYLTTSEFAKAREAYAAASSQQPDNAHAGLGLASVYAMDPETFEKAEECLHAILHGDSRNSTAHYQLGQLYAKMHRTSTGVTELRKAVELNADFAGAHLLLGRLLAELGEEEQSRQHLARFKEITDREESDKQAGRRAEDLLRQGADLARRNELDQAIETFNDVLRLKPKSAAAHAMLAKVYLSKNELRLAHEHIAESVRLDGYNGEYHYLLALVLGREKNYEGAIPEVQAASILIPNLSDVENLFGNLYSDLARYSEAVPHYLKAIELDPGEPHSRLNLAIAYQRLGKDDESEKQMIAYRRLLGAQRQ